MATAEWKINKFGQSCVICSKKIEVGEVCCSALFEPSREEGKPATADFARRDYCEPCFNQHPPEGMYYYWKLAAPDPTVNIPPKKPVLDVEAVLDFFRRLATDSDPTKRPLAFVLALMLDRKKVLKFTGEKRREDGESLLVFTMRRGGESFELIPPGLDEQELAAAGRELNQILGVSAPPAPAAALAPAPSEAPATEAQETARTEAVAGVESNGTLGT